MKLQTSAVHARAMSGHEFANFRDDFGADLGILRILDALVDHYGYRITRIQVRDSSDVVLAEVIP